MHVVPLTRSLLSPHTALPDMPMLCAFLSLRSPLAGEADEEEEDVRMVRPASAQPVEVDEDFEREFSQVEGVGWQVCWQ